MKKYEVQCKDNIDDEWWVIDSYNSLEEANEIIASEKHIDEENGVKYMSQSIKSGRMPVNEMRNVKWQVQLFFMMIN